MLLYLFVLFTLLPLIEVFLLGALWSQVGLLWTLALVLGTGFAGAALARLQGVKVLMRIQRRMARGQVPADELFDGALLLVAGCLLITPGVLTDLLGMALLLPPVRGLLKYRLRSWAAKNVRVQVSSMSSQFGQRSAGPHFDPTIVEGEIVPPRAVDRR